MNRDITDELIEKVHQYLQNEMNNSERKEFENQIESDPILKKIIHQEKIILIGIQTYYNKSLKSKIKNIESQYLNHNYKKIYTMPKFSKIALLAAMLFLAVAVVYFTKNNNSPNVDQIIANNYSRETTQAQKILASYDQQGFMNIYNNSDSFKLAMKYYKDEDYKNAIINFQNFLQVFPEDKTALLYIGICYYSEGHYATAIKYLNSLAIDTNFDQRDDAIWALSFCLLKAEDGKQNAVRYFSICANDSQSKYSHKCKKMLDLIK
ncbi:MAG: hypothetical protein WAS55_02175 [Saprospiraceae bacterium]|nr:tetratricopeptide repeat protein [Saprospiraceae bacterium]